MKNHFYAADLISGTLAVVAAVVVPSTLLLACGVVFLGRAAYQFKKSR